MSAQGTADKNTNTGRFRSRGFLQLLGLLRSRRPIEAKSKEHFLPPFSVANLVSALFPLTKSFLNPHGLTTPLEKERVRFYICLLTSPHAVEQAASLGSCFLKVPLAPSHSP